MCIAEGEDQTGIDRRRGGIGRGDATEHTIDGAQLRLELRRRAFELRRSLALEARLTLSIERKRRLHARVCATRQVRHAAHTIQDRAAHTVVGERFEGHVARAIKAFARLQEPFKPEGDEVL